MIEELTMFEKVVTELFPDDFDCSEDSNLYVKYYNQGVDIVNIIMPNPYLDKIGTQILKNSDSIIVKTPGGKDKIFIKENMKINDCCIHYNIDILNNVLDEIIIGKCKICQTNFILEIHDIGYIIIEKVTNKKVCNMIKEEEEEERKIRGKTSWIPKVIINKIINKEKDKTQFKWI